MKHLGLSVLVSWLLVGCVCEPGQLLCGSYCTNLMNDAANCGGCGFACVGTCTYGSCDPAGACRSDADCDDGRNCNGREYCNTMSNGSSVCFAGGAINCGDRSACTRDLCVEPGTCTNEPDDASCESGVCTAAGCESCDELPCRLRAPQCGCHDGEGCYDDGFDFVSCETAGTSPLGSACSISYQCTPGLTCLSGVCSSLCVSDSDCPSPDRTCLFEGTIVAPTHGVCASDCDVVRQTGCAPGAECALLEDGDGLGALCLVRNTIAPGASCAGATFDCRDGLCVNQPTGPVCEEWCLTNSDCPSTHVCGGFVEPIQFRGRTLGSCRRRT